MCRLHRHHIPSVFFNVSHKMRPLEEDWLRILALIDIHISIKTTYDVVSVSCETV